MGGDIRKYNDETHLDEIIDIIRFRFLNYTDESTTLLLLWYIHNSKTKYCYPDDKKYTTDTNSIYELVKDYEIIDLDCFKKFSNKLDFIKNSSKKSESEDCSIDFINMVEDAYNYNLTFINANSNNITVGFLYGLLLKIGAIDISTMNTIHPAIGLDSIVSYSMIFYNIMKMIDKDEFMNISKYPSVTKEEIKSIQNDANPEEKEPDQEPEKQEEVKEEIKESEKTEPVMEEIKEEVKTEVTSEKPQPKTQPVSLGIKIPEEVSKIIKKNRPLELLNIKDKYKGKYKGFKNKNSKIDMVKTYNAICTGAISVNDISKKYGVCTQTIYNKIQEFCDDNDLPKPIYNAISQKKEIKSVEPQTEINSEESLFQKAQIQNSREIHKMKSSKVFFPSKIEGLKEEITGQTSQNQKRRFVNRPVLKSTDGKELKLTKEQLIILKDKGAGWMTLNDNRPYYVTTDLRIWRNKPNAQDLLLEARI